MGGRGSFSTTMKSERLGSLPNKIEKSIKIPAAPFLAISGNRVSKEETFQHIEGIIAKNSFETGVIVDPQGFPVAAYKGGPHSVSFGVDQSKVKGNFVTHNHPSGYAVFSPGDLTTSASLGAMGVRATTLKNGTASLVRVSSRADFNGLAVAYHRYLSAGGRTAGEATAWISQNAGKYGLKFTLEK